MHDKLSDEELRLLKDPKPPFIVMKNMNYFIVCVKERKKERCYILDAKEIKEIAKHGTKCNRELSRLVQQWYYDSEFYVRDELKRLKRKALESEPADEKDLKCRIGTLEQTLENGLPRQNDLAFACNADNKILRKLFIKRYGNRFYEHMPMGKFVIRVPLKYSMRFSQKSGKTDDKAPNRSIECPHISEESKGFFEDMKATYDFMEKIKPRLMADKKGNLYEDIAINAECYENWQINRNEVEVRGAVYRNGLFNIPTTSRIEIHPVDISWKRLLNILNIYYPELETEHDKHGICFHTGELSGDYARNQYPQLILRAKPAVLQEKTSELLRRIIG